MTTSQVQFQDSDDTKVSLESDGASSIMFRGDNGSELAFGKNIELISNGTDATASPFTISNAIHGRVFVVNSAETDPFYVDLPATSTVANGRTFRVKDDLGNASSFPIHIRPNGVEQIEGASVYVLNVNRSSVTLYRKGNHWNVE